jgi:hypothetical protein
LEQLHTHEIFYVLVIKFHYAYRGDAGNIKSHLSLEKWDLDVQASYAAPRVYG